MSSTTARYENLATFNECRKRHKAKDNGLLLAGVRAATSNAAVGKLKAKG